MTNPDVITMENTPEHQANVDAIAHAFSRGQRGKPHPEAKGHALMPYGPGLSPPTKFFNGAMGPIEIVTPVAPIELNDPIEPIELPEGPEVALCPNCLRVIEEGIAHDCVCEEAA